MMKKYSYLLFIFLLCSLTSCLNSGLEELPEFEENDIIGVQKVEYRYYSDQISNVNGEAIVKNVGLSNVPTINKDTKYIAIEVTVPNIDDNFPAAEREKCSTQKLAVMVSLSTAARIFPVGDAPKFGLPGNWSKPNKYIVEAANGNKQEWTIEITQFKK